MRWIVITLLVINAAYFVWQRQFAVDTAAVVPTVVTDKQLRLASELNAVTAPVAPVAEQPHGANSNDDKNRQQHAVAVPSSNKGVETQSPAPAVDPVPSRLRACYSIGPFLLVNDVSSTAKIFDGVDGVATQQRATAERSQVGYWVYVPPLDTLQAARAVLRDLQNREIRDVLVISEGAKANAISAGVYNVEGQAQERRDAISALGYKAEIDPLYRTQAQYWLDVELMKSQAIPAKLWQKVVKNFPNITRTERPCE